MGRVQVRGTSPPSLERKFGPPVESQPGSTQLTNLSFLLTPVIVASIDLGLFGIIAEKCSAGSSSKDAACVSSSEIACHLGTQYSNAPKVLDQMLRLLATHSLLTASCRTLEDGRVEILYGTNSLSKMLIQNEDGVSLARFASLPKYYNDHVTKLCSALKDAVFEVDRPKSPCLKQHLYETLQKNKKYGIDFDKSMSENSHFVVKSILKHSKAFDGLKSLVDVGGGNGTSLNMILSRYPSILGINFDLPRVIKTASSFYIGIENVAGDMFEEIPKGDAILLKWVLHNWNDEKCLTILKNCYLALPESGKVIVVELVLSNTPRTTTFDKYASLFDILMFSTFRANERTELEFKAMAKGAGFSKFEVQYCGYGHSVMELFK